jgi:hypothetical protein
LNSPFSEYRGLFNVKAVFVPSAQSGIDQHLLGTMVDTSFDAVTQGADGRLGAGDDSRVSFVLDRVVPPRGRDLVVVLMNTDTYANGASRYAWIAASNRFAYDVVLHEIGHSYAGLQDEYLDATLGQGALPSMLKSVHVALSPTTVPWSHWLGYQDELGVVGAYEGGLYRATGVWRATPTSKMLQNERPFSVPQKEAFIEQFYRQIGDYLAVSAIGTGAPKAVVPDLLPVRLEWQLQGRVVSVGAQLDAKALVTDPVAVTQTPAASRLTVAAMDDSGMLRDTAILSVTRQTDSLELLLGSSLADQFAGTEAMDVILAGEGDDSIQGLSGADVIYGHAGGDVLMGDAGDDSLAGGPGNDLIDGGEGTDTAVFMGRRADYDITWSASASSFSVTSLAEGTDSLSRIETLRFLDGSFSASALQNPSAPSAPTLTAVSPLTGASEDSAFTITYAELAAAADEADAQGDPIAFRVESVTSGTLTKNGATVVAGTTQLASGEQLVWTPEANANGALSAFKARAVDATLASANVVQVIVSVAAVNDPPVLANPIPDASTAAGSNLNFAVAANAFSDIDSSVLTYIATRANGLALPAWLSFNATKRTFSGTPAAGDTGAEAIRVTASDGALSASDEFTLTVGGVPHAASFSPSDGARSVPVNSSLAITFGGSIQLGTGPIVLKTADGKVVETFTAVSATVSGSTLTLNPTADLSIFTKYVVELSAGAVKDLAGNGNAADSRYDFQTATVDGLYHFFVVAFAAAPGATYMGQLAEAVNFGLSLPQIVEIFTTKKQFTDVYPTTMSNRELATQLVNNIVKTSASAATKTAAIDDIDAALGIGWSRGKMLYTVFGNLASKALTDLVWGGTAQQFQKQLTVARYFTEEMGVATENLAALRGVIANITPETDVSTVDQILQIIGTPPPGG